MKKLVCVNDADEGSREGWNPFYMSYFIVESQTLDFSEPEFSDSARGLSVDELEEKLKSYGYAVTSLEDVVFVDVAEKF